MLLFWETALKVELFYIFVLQLTGTAFFPPQVMIIVTDSRYTEISL